MVLGEVETCRTNISDKWLFIINCAVYWIKHRISIWYCSAVHILQYKLTFSTQLQWKFDVISLRIVWPDSLSLTTYDCCLVSEFHTEITATFAAEEVQVVVLTWRCTTWCLPTRNRIPWLSLPLLLYWSSCSSDVACQGAIPHNHLLFLVEAHEGRGLQA